MMMSKTDLERCARADLHTCCPRDLVDLKDVTIDTSLPVAQRIDRFLDQVRNPYLFQVDGLVVKVKFAGSKRVSSALGTLLSHQ